jgi:hypothetical protein
MPCYRCGARQTDPKRGPSPWKRGVRAGTQVLVCPDCQRVHDWTTDLDRCTTCGSTALARALGDTTCRSCGTTQTETATSSASTGADPALAAEVEAALDRVLRGPKPQ